MALPAIQELSLLGLFVRLDHIERLTQKKKPEEEEADIIASEGAVKKEIASQLGAVASDGISSGAAARAKAFLQAQVKAVDQHDKHASAKKEKFAELLQGIDKAPSAEDPPHVKRARDALRRVKQEFKDSHEIYTKWEKGKMMFKTNDELKAMQTRHSDTEKCLEATQNFIDEMLALKRSDARPPALPTNSSSAARPKPKSAPSRAADPSVRSGGGYPSASRSGAPGPSQSALLQAQMAAQVRVEAEVRAAIAAPQPQAREPPRAPRVNLAKVVEQENETVVLSYSCTCRAVAEICSISVDKARDMAESSKDFIRLLNREQWQEVKERSIAIEKEDKIKEKENEQRKKDAKLAKITNKQGPPVVQGASAPTPSRPAATAPKAAGKSKAASKPKAAASGKKSGGLSALAQANPWGGFADSDSDD